LDTQRIVSELKKERDRLSRAIALLDGPEGESATRTEHASASVSKVGAPRKRRHLTPEGRKRLSDLMKKRWSDRRKKGSQGRKQSAKAA
jgi:Spy/CpxP family protein refolding chaperone